jgi:hypothetical protein
MIVHALPGDFFGVWGSMGDRAISVDVWETLGKYSPQIGHVTWLRRMA